VFLQDPEQVRAGQISANCSVNLADQGRDDQQRRAVTAAPSKLGRI
jgi:hypothetical protein